jgi:hypothetical protein
MSISVSRRRDSEESWGDLRLAVEFLVPRSWEVDELGQRVVRRELSAFELRRLYEHRPVCELWISTTVIEVEMAVHNKSNVMHRHT